MRAKLTVRCSARILGGAYTPSSIKGLLRGKPRAVYSVAINIYDYLLNIM